MTLVQYLVKEQTLSLDFDDDIISSACVAHAGDVKNQRVKDLLAQLLQVSR